MSPWPMMLEQGVPTIYMEAYVLEAAYRLWKKGKHVPHIMMAGGFIDSTQIFKAIALSKWPNGGPGPFVRAIAMAKPILTAVFKAKLYAEWAEKGELAKRNRAFAEVYGDKVESIFAVYHELKQKFGDRVKKVPHGAIGIYSYAEYIGVGLKQLMAGARRFKLDLLDRSLLATLTPHAKEVLGIPMIHEIDRDAIDTILEG